MIAEACYNDVLEIRHKVLYPNKDIEYVKLKEDNFGLHIGYFIDQRPISIFSLFLDQNKLQFRKFATLVQYQQKGYGTKLMEWLLNYTAEMKFESVWCNARYDKVAFYKKFGFTETKDTFEKGGIKYIVLERKSI